jgi:mannose-6-phosphate isomerase
MKEAIFLEPVFKERIWGGTKLKELFGYDIPSPITGECWAVSAHPNGQSVVRNGTLAGKTLGELWSGHKELFGNSLSQTFPLLIKLLDASDDLSVQVHPDDAYAGQHENGELGKTECWYVLDCEPGAEIIFGHHAATKAELIEMINNGRWDSLLTRVKVKTGDFFYVPSGTLHALGKGIVVLETQQSSDTTYRVYDYDRRDAAGNLRELHLDKAVDVTTVPHRSSETSPQTVAQEGAAITTLVSNDFFTVQKLDVDGSFSSSIGSRFSIFSVIAGEGTLTYLGQSHPLTKGDHFILPANFGSFTISGRLDIIVSRE